jgi:ABC-2 type transport system permease protein
MLGVIVAKELTEYRRDGRVLAILGLIGGLICVALLSAWATHVKQERQVLRSQAHDQETFLRQGSKPSHSAAHFGRMAYKPPAALAVFDAGTSPYLGQVIWLEAHRQDPAMFRPAEDAPELSRLADLSVAGVLTSLLPLLIFVIGSGAFAMERERGTIHQLVTAGAGAGAIFRGKLVALAAIPVLVSFIVIAASTAVAVASSEIASASDTIFRGAGLCLGFAAYALACAGIALFVSARARTGSSALLTLLTIWAVSTIAVPRIAASVAELSYRTPDGTTFWTQVAENARAARPKRGSEELRSIERLVVSRAIGRELSEQDLASLELNRAALGQEVSEVLGARAHAAAYARLNETYDRQRRIRRAASIFSPTIALMHWSSGIAGTDLSAHGHFAAEAERQRQLIIRRMNEDMMVNGARQGYDYLASADFWRTVPDFNYQPPPIDFAIRSALPDLLLLLAWSFCAISVAWLGARRRLTMRQA